MEYEFRWNDWNVEHIAWHGISPGEAEYIVRHARAPFSEARGEGKFQTAGQTDDGRYIQVIHIFSPEDVIFVIHARPLTKKEIRRFKRRTR